MANHPHRSSAHRKLAEAAGYFVREGTEQTGTENLIGRWYVGRNGEPFSTSGRGYPSRGAGLVCGCQCGEGSEPIGIQR